MSGAVHTAEISFLLPTTKLVERQASLICSPFEKQNFGVTWCDTRICEQTELEWQCTWVQKHVFSLSVPGHCLKTNNFLPCFLKTKQNKTEKTNPPLSKMYWLSVGCTSYGCRTMAGCRVPCCTRLPQETAILGNYSDSSKDTKN